MRRCKRFWLSFLIFTALAGPSIPLHASVITDYHPVSLYGRGQGGRQLIAIRAFTSDGFPRFLAVDPFTLTTEVVDAPRFFPLNDETGKSADTPFQLALHRHAASPFPMQNDGAVHADWPASGVYLTVDLCPSRAPFEKGLFETVERLSHDKGGAMPVAVAISGLWLEKHPEEFGWLVNEENLGRLAITWVNHSWDHPYHQGEPLEHNFLLAAGSDFDQEILRVEQALLARGVTPSVFFRFPGLISDERLVKRLRELSLIPLGSDAWLAKGEAPKEGSFILVHGNGNEPKGVRLFQELAKKGGLRLLDLRQAFRGGEGVPPVAAGQVVGGPLRLPRRAEHHVN
ncbi:MAG: polysaccharide deacetylase [Geobacter sp.]|nr:polysaccharide deacetylase [Geobacter sp.]